ncbi:Retrovirus-related Pol polyprotein from transposon 297 [Araneus ventricosus]|uniref:RNA-directed DNA polymerase n=1 Tax=Araneus ventricosus TaxID=182803 RepID=A0A4Y2PY42_ARAVE|nr:Retrovirus-related Pol polyprotein from transposon 297 [Araneus ventricosus]
MAQYLTLCERQFKILKVPPDLWVTYLISSLPAEIGRLLAREPETKIHDFEYVKTALLQCFRMNAEKYRILFSQHKKVAESTWEDFAFELQTYFQSSSDELEIKTMEDLKALIISDQVKKRCGPDYKNHLLDEWNPPADPEIAKSKVTSYGCGTPDVTKPKCPTYSPTKYRTEFSALSVFESSTLIAFLPIRINQVNGIGCADSGATHSIAEEDLYKILQKQGMKFIKESISMTFALGHSSNSQVLTTQTETKLLLPALSVLIDLFASVWTEKCSSNFPKIDNFKNGLKDVTILSYLDDIIILSQTFEEHLEDLRKVFQRLKQYKLQANRDKCHIACSKIKYSEHFITPNGIEVDPEKTSVIQDMPEPKNAKQVQSFLQTCSWYRLFIPNVSDVARPLSNLTKKTYLWRWEQEELKAFNTLKQLLVSPPFLKDCDPAKNYIIRTDASNFALGDVLAQGEIPDEHPNEYASRLLASAEKNYSRTEREALAVVWALQKFRGYIEGVEIVVASDHLSLRWLISLKSPSGRLARWALQLQEFNLKICYTPGKSNVIADMLSRPFIS